MAQPHSSYSISKELRKENKINNEFEAMLSHLTMEEIIALKLELATRAVGGKFYGNYLFKVMPYIAKDAVVRYALSATETKKAATMFLGVTRKEFNRIYRRYFKRKQTKNDNT